MMHFYSSRKAQNPSSRYFLVIFFLLIFCNHPLFAARTLFLRDEIQRAEPGDYLVTAQFNAFTLMLIRDKTDSTLTIEEVTIPEGRFPKGHYSKWRDWFLDGAPGATSWVTYVIAPKQRQLLTFFSHTTGTYCSADSTNTFLCTLLGLRFFEIPESQRKRIGGGRSGAPVSIRPVWNPPIVFEGQKTTGVPFTAWRTLWPNDSTELAGKEVDIYLPEENTRYPAYFPYWLEIKGTFTKAKIRITDTGKGLHSTKPLPKIPQLSQQRGG
ncbi:MAG: hypothetical protein KDK40_03755 [Chlamydiia bacterium]|nr:hypothetical protein [Chlamydiia bacterium]